MRPTGTFLVTLACALGMVACEGRDFFEELRPEPVSALNGIYREKTTQAASRDPEAYTELSLEEGNLSFVSLNADEPDAPPERKVLVARVLPAEGISYEMQPTEDLEPLVAGDARAGFLAKLFSEEGRVRILRQGNDLKVTEIRGAYRRTSTWERIPSAVLEGRRISHELAKAAAYGSEIRRLRSELLAHWGASTMEIFEQIETRELEGRSETKVTPGSELAGKDEVQTLNEDGSPGKYSLRLNRLKLVSANEALINDAHPAELKFSLRPGPDGRNALYLVIESAADPIRYQARSIEGFVEPDGAGFRLTYLPPKEVGYETLAIRYSPEGATAPAPTEPTTPDIPVSPIP